MAKVTRRETRPGETFLGGKGILVPFNPNRMSGSPEKSATPSSAYRPEDDRLGPPEMYGTPSSAAPAHPLDGEDISIRPSLISNGVPRDRWPSGQISPQQAADLIARYGSKAPSTSEKPQD